MAIHVQMFHATIKPINRYEKNIFNAAASAEFDDEIPFINSINFIGSLFYTNSSKNGNEYLKASKIEFEQYVDMRLEYCFIKHSRVNEEYSIMYLHVCVCGT